MIGIQQCHNTESWYKTLYFWVHTKFHQNILGVTWAWSLAKGQYMVSWLLTGAPEQRYWQNRETANVGLDSSVGRAPARQSGGRRFKSRSSQFSLFIQIYLKSVPSQFPLWFITWHILNFIQTKFCKNNSNLLKTPLPCFVGAMLISDIHEEKMYFEYFLMQIEHNNLLTLGRFPSKWHLASKVCSCDSVFIHVHRQLLFLWTLYIFEPLEFDLQHWYHVIILLFCVVWVHIMYFNLYHTGGTQTVGSRVLTPPFWLLFIYWFCLIYFKSRGLFCIPFLMTLMILFLEYMYVIILLMICLTFFMRE